MDLDSAKTRLFRPSCGLAETVDNVQYVIVNHLSWGDASTLVSYRRGGNGCVVTYLRFRLTPPVSYLEHYLCVEGPKPFDKPFVGGYELIVINCGLPFTSLAVLPDIGMTRYYEANTSTSKFFIKGSESIRNEIVLVSHVLVCGGTDKPVRQRESIYIYRSK